MGDAWKDERIDGWRDGRMDEGTVGANLNFTLAGNQI